MKFSELLEVVADEPVFEASLLLAGGVDTGDIRRQLSRWTKAGKLYQLRRGMYALAPPYHKIKPHPFTIANRMLRASYVSCQSALAYYDLIPEYAPVVTSVTTARPTRWDTHLGSYLFRHIKISFFWGYQLIELSRGQQAFIATPEKALLDLVYLQTGGDSSAFLKSLRLQNLDRLDSEELRRQAERWRRPKLSRAAEVVEEMARVEMLEYELE